MEKFITKSERNLDRYANSLNNYILRGGQITDIHIEELKSMLNLYNLELDKIHKKTALSTKELSIVFGFSISWITKMTSKKLIPFYKNSNGHCVFIRKDFEEWLSNPEILEIKFKEYENEKIIIETFIPDEVCEVLQDEIDNVKNEFVDFECIRTTNINEEKKRYNNYKKYIILFGGIILLMIIIISLYFLNN
mgnify:CR=1 FL=1